MARGDSGGDVRDVPSFATVTIAKVTSHQTNLPGEDDGDMTPMPTDAVTPVRSGTATGIIPGQTILGRPSSCKTMPYESLK